MNLCRSTVRCWMGVVAVLACAALAAGQPESSTAVMAADFSTAPDSAWTHQPPAEGGEACEWIAAGGRDGGCLHIKTMGGAAEAVSVWKRKIAEPPRGRELRLSIWVKGAGVKGEAFVCAQAWNRERTAFLEFASTQGEYELGREFGWTKIETTLAVPRSASEVQVLVLLKGEGEVWFDDLVATAGGAARANAPGLFTARGKFTLRGEGTTKVLMPIPLSYRDQVPLNYELAVNPPSKIAGTRIYEDKPGNWVAELSLRGLARSKTVEVEWSSVVLVGPSDFSGVPKQAERPAAWPAEARPWLASTWCVQSGDARIRDVAREIRGDSTDVMRIIEATLARTKEIYAAQSGRCMSLDAVSALDKQGSCTSCANLVAALLRANYVPARILSGYPAWSGPLQTHYIVEAYVPGYGWYPIESTMLRAPWANHQQVAVAIVPPEYEGDAARPRSQAASAVPFLSLTERSAGSADFETMGTVDATRIGCDHEAKVLCNLPEETTPAEWSALLGAARRNWAAWLAGSPSSDAGAGLKAGLTMEVMKEASVDGLRRALEPGGNGPIMP